MIRCQARNMWVATPWGLASTVAASPRSSKTQITVQFPWGGCGYMQEHHVTTSYDFQCTCFSAAPARFTLRLSLAVSLRGLRERIIQHLQVPLYVENIAIMQPSVSGKHILVDTSSDDSSCLFTSLRPLLIVVLPHLKLNKLSSLLHVEACATEPTGDPPKEKSTDAASTGAEIMPSTPPRDDDSPSSPPPLDFQAVHAAFAPPTATTTYIMDALSSITQVARGCGCALGAESFLASGRKYWEIRIDATAAPPSSCNSGLLVGVACSDLALNTTVVGSGIFWGFDVHSGKKASLSLEPFAEECDVGDIVGTLYDADRGLLSFYRNGRPLGTAFRNLFARRLCPAFASTHVGVRFTVLPSTIPPPSEEPKE
ncbi:Aste57867_10378 [Aphanomyces stellatus]|uniref:Aste57867_10378 protein n=1 Tax=Aphanomyces stellatus TaxID=120398 RepID=A0A485KQ70_9STRA|nr:hypothetical protein As57867_010338 [Aphanomyces stellatus]VFT87252.1 Aste57867_10378 [Aphanomyces stellatus]